MSSSEKASKIDILDSAESIAAKIKDAFCPQGEVENNGVLAFVKMVLFAVHEAGFTVKREERFGGDTTFASYQELEDAYVAKQVFPLDLKNVRACTHPQQQHTAAAAGERPARGAGWMRARGTVRRGKTSVWLETDRGRLSATSLRHAVAVSLLLFSSP